MPRRSTTVVVALAAMLLLAVPAAAHPYFEGGEAPVDSLASLTLTMAHGCGDESDGGGAPTTEVSMQVPDWMRVMVVPEPEDWRTSQELHDSGDVEVVTWTNPDADEPAPSFDLDVVVSGEVGAERHVRVSQSCEDDTIRWVGTPDDPADDPAVNLTLVAADPDAPPPEPPDRDERPPDPQAPDDEQDDDPPDEPAGEDPQDDPAATTDDTDDDAAARAEVVPSDDAPADVDNDWWAWMLALVVVGAGIVVVVWRARGGRA